VRVQYVHASKFGNGARVAEHFARDMAARGVDVAVDHVRDVDPAQMGDANMYLFSSPGRMGKPIRSMRRFLKDLRLSAGTRSAILTTEMAPRPDKDGRMPTEEEICRWQRVRPIMNELLRAKGLVPVAEDVVYVTDLKRPLEDGWEEKVRAFAMRVCEAMEVPA
jgi:menaquinone-dependent protoporphyrinogen IX oxidase